MWIVNFSFSRIVNCKYGISTGTVKLQDRFSQVVIAAQNVLNVVSRVTLNPFVGIQGHKSRKALDLFQNFPLSFIPFRQLLSTLVLSCKSHAINLSTVLHSTRSSSTPALQILVSSSPDLNSDLNSARNWTSEAHSLKHLPIRYPLN